MPNYYYPAIIAFIILISYTSYIFLKKPSEKFPWLHTLFSTISSTLIGITIGFFLFYSQEEYQDKSNKKKYTELLTVEISGIRGHLLNPARAPFTTQSGNKVSLNIVGLRAEVIAEAALSGLFNEQESNRMLEIAQSIDSWNRKTEGLMGAINSQWDTKAYDQRVTWYVENLELSRIGLISLTDDLTDKLNLKLKPTKVY